MPLLGVKRTNPRAARGVTRLHPRGTTHRLLYLRSRSGLRAHEDWQRDERADASAVTRSASATRLSLGAPDNDGGLSHSARQDNDDGLSHSARQDNDGGSSRSARQRVPSRSGRSAMCASTAEILARDRRRFERTKERRRLQSARAGRTMGTRLKLSRKTRRRREQGWVSGQYSAHDRRTGFATSSVGPSVLSPVSTLKAPGYWARTGNGGQPDTESAPAIRFQLRRAAVGQPTAHMVAHIPQTVRPEMVAVLEGVARKVHRFRLDNPLDWLTGERVATAKFSRRQGRRRAEEAQRQRDTVRGEAEEVRVGDRTVTASRSRGDLGITAGRRGYAASQQSQQTVQALQAQRTARQSAVEGAEGDTRRMGSRWTVDRPPGTTLPQPQRLRLGDTVPGGVKSLRDAARTKRRQAAFEAAREAKRQSWAAKYAASRARAAKDSEQTRLVRLVWGGGV